MLKGKKCSLELANNDHQESHQIIVLSMSDGGLYCHHEASFAESIDRGDGFSDEIHFYALGTIDSIHANQT